MLWIVWLVYLFGVVAVASALWVFDYQNQRWKENIVWATTWPIWVVFWAVAIVMALFLAWL